jgi:hypothetical protein
VNGSSRLDARSPGRPVRGKGMPVVTYGVDEAALALGHPGMPVTAAGLTGRAGHDRLRPRLGYLPAGRDRRSRAMPSRCEEGVPAAAG